MFSTITNTDYEIQYRDIIQSCLSNEAVYREDRTGVGCYSVFNKQIDIEVGNKFPVITGRKMFPKVFNTEMLWFLNGETNIQRFKDAGVKIWDAWANEDGELGPVYGHQLRNFNNQNYDQLEDVIDSLNNDPDSRRHVISLWNPVQLEDMAFGSWYVNVLAAYERFRGRGFGTDLLAIAEDLAKQNECNGLSIIVSDGNTGARRLYERMGYVEQATRPMVREDWENDGNNWVLLIKSF